MNAIIDNLVCKVFEHGKTQPDQTAVIHQQQSISYQTLCARVAGLCFELQQIGIGPQQMIATYLPRSIDLVVAMLAIHACRAIFVPLGVSVSSHKTQHKLQQGHINFLIRNRHSPPLETQATVIAMDDVPEADPGQLKLAPYSDSDIAYVLFTSGSTGIPKGVNISHQALLRHMQWKNHTFSVSAKAIELQKVPLCFDVSIRELFGWIIPGNTLLIVPEGHEANPQVLCQLIEQFHCEELSMVPSLLDGLLGYLEAFDKSPQLAHLKRVLVGGEVLTAATVNRFYDTLKAYDIDLINLYGPAETTIEVTFYNCRERPLSNKDPVPIGRACHRGSLSIRDDQNKPVDVGAIGELHVCGSQVATGYLNPEAANLETFYRNSKGERCYNTGDLVHQTKEGLLYFHGRRDQQIKINGHRVELEEIRHAFDPLISPSQVIIDSEQNANGYIISAYVQIQALQSTHPTQAQLLTHLKKYLADYLLPHQIFAVSQFPLLGAGKMDRSKLDEFVLPWPHARQYGSHLSDPGIVERFEAIAAKHPDKAAIFTDQEQISYGALNNKANHIAQLLINHHQIGCEKIVALLMPTHIKWVACVLAILKAGGAYLPLSTTAPNQRNQYYLDDSQAQLLLTDSGYFGSLKANQVNLDLHENTSSTSVNPKVRRADNSLIQLLYTSGSTGQPKGVLIEQQGLYHSLANKQQLNPLARTQATCLNTATTFDVSGWELFGWIYAQSSLVIPPAGFESDPKILCHLVEQHNVGELQFAPSMLHAFLQYVEQYELGGCLAKLNNIRSAGDVLKPDTVALFHRLLYQPYRIELINSYGPTETTIDACQWTLNTAATNDRIPIGLPHVDMDIYVLNEQNRLCANGTIGQLAITGMGVARGYLNKPEQSQTRFIDDPFVPGGKMYLTGDNGFYDEHGVLQFIGRCDHQVKIHGHRIELAEIEQAFYRFLPSNKVVIHPETIGRDKKLVAYIETAALKHAGIDIVALREELHDILPAFLVPPYIHSIDCIPLNASGKFDRRKLASMVETLTPMNDNAPDKLKQLVQQAFNLPYIPDWDEPLSRFGADSISIIHLISEIKRQLNQELPIAAVMQHHTLNELRQLIEQNQTQSSSHWFLTFNPHAKTPLYCFPPASGYGFAYAQLAKHLPQYRLLAYHFPDDTQHVVEHYAEHIKSTHQAGPIIMLGYSGGGNLAVAVAKRLELMGIPVAKILMVDAYPQHRGIKQLTPLLHQLKAQMLATTIRDLAQQGLKPACISAKVNAYYDHHWLQATEVLDPINADIISIHSPHRDLAQQLISDPQLCQVFAPSWASATYGSVRELNGSGKHNDMLRQPYVQANAQLIESSLTEQLPQENQS